MKEMGIVAFPSSYFFVVHIQHVSCFLRTLVKMFSRYGA